MAFAKSRSENVVKIAWNYYQYSYRNKFESELVQFLTQAMISWKWACAHSPCIEQLLVLRGVGSLTAEVIGVRQLAPYGGVEGKFSTKL